MTTTIIPRHLSLASIPEVCDVLRGWGHPQLAYLASDEELDDGDQLVALEGA